MAQPRVVLPRRQGASQPERRHIVSLSLPPRGGATYRWAAGLGGLSALVLSSKSGGGAGGGWGCASGVASGGRAGGASWVGAPLRICTLAVGSARAARRQAGRLPRDSLTAANNAFEYNFDFVFFAQSTTDAISS